MTNFVVSFLILTQKSCLYFRISQASAMYDVVLVSVVFSQQNINQMSENIFYVKIMVLIKEFYFITHEMIIYWINYYVSMTCLSWLY